MYDGSKWQLNESPSHLIRKYKQSHRSTLIVNASHTHTYTHSNLLYVCLTSAASALPCSLMGGVLAKEKANWLYGMSAEGTKRFLRRCVVQHVLLVTFRERVMNRCISVVRNLQSAGLIPEKVSSAREKAFAPSKTPFVVVFLFLSCIHTFPNLKSDQHNPSRWKSFQMIISFIKEKEKTTLMFARNTQARLVESTTSGVFLCAAFTTRRQWITGWHVNIHD